MVFGYFIHSILKLCISMFDENDRYILQYLYHWVFSNWLSRRTHNHDDNFLLALIIIFWFISLFVSMCLFHCQRVYAKVLVKWLWYVQWPYTHIICVADDNNLDLNWMQMFKALDTKWLIYMWMNMYLPYRRMDEE